MTDSREEILGMQEAAQLLGISRKHLSNILLGKVAGAPPIPHVRAGRRNLIRRSVLVQWFKDCERQNTPQAIEAA